MCHGQVPSPSCLTPPEGPKHRDLVPRAQKLTLIGVLSSCCLQCREQPGLPQVSHPSSKRSAENDSEISRDRTVASHRVLPGQELHLGFPCGCQGSKTLPSRMQQQEARPEAEEPGFKFPIGDVRDPSDGLPHSATTPTSMHKIIKRYHTGAEMWL